MNDFDLVAGVTRRDPEAFRALMERYAGPVVNVAFRLLGNRADAEEIGQETFLRLYRRPPRLAPSSKLFTWLYRVAANLCLDLLRRRSRTPPQDSLDLPVSSDEEEQRLPAQDRASRSGLTPRETAARSETAAAVRRAVCSLPAGLRAPLLLSAVEGLSHAEISEILEISPKAVERRLSRARLLLKQRLQPYL